MKKIWHLTVLSLLILVSCSIPLDQSSPYTPTVSGEISISPTLQDNTDKPSSTNTAMPTPSLTHLPDTPTPEITDEPPSTETLISTTPTEALLEYRCLEIDPDPPTNGLYPGTIVLTAYPKPSYLLDLSTGNMRLLLEDSEQASFAEVVSQDRKWLAYIISDPAQILVVSLIDESAPIRISWDENWFALDGWLNNQTLLVSGEGDSPNMVINPFSGEQIHVFSNFPEHNRDPGTWFEQYNPQLTRVVYNRFPDKDGNHIALWNLQSQETITTIHSYAGVGPYGTQPVWSPTGDEFIISLSHKDQDSNSWYTELYRISQDGEQNQITNLRAYYTEYLFIQEYQWSPDESQIAFWLRYTQDGQSKNQLAILDMETYQVMNYCIDDRFGTSRELVWSPDGRKIVVNAQYDKEPAVLLIDLDRQTAFRIAGDMKAVGWMISSP